MKKTKCPFLRTILLILSIALLLNTAVPSVFATETEIDDMDPDTDILDSGFCGDGEDGKNLSWVLKDDGTLIISGEGEIVPTGLTVPWFKYSAEITALEIGDGVTGICEEAFYCCTNLTEVSLPESLETIGDYAFCCCIALVSVDIPANVKTIGEYAFFRCEKLASITIPNGVTVISDYTFAKCLALTSVNLPSGVTEIREAAFAQCTMLGKTVLPESLETIGDSAFYACARLQIDGLPEGVVSIGSYAFGICSSIKSLTISKNVTSLGDNIFCGSSKLTEFIVDDENPNYCSVDGVLFTKDMTRLIAFPGKKAGKYIVPEGVEEISDGAFYNCPGVTEVFLPISVARIGDDAFGRCKALTKINIPLNCKEIGSFSFDDTPDVVITACRGSYAQSYAKAHEIAFNRLFDLNYNGIEDLEDLSMLLDHLTGRQELEGEQLMLAANEETGVPTIREFNLLFKALGDVVQSTD